MSETEALISVRLFAMYTQGSGLSPRLTQSLYVHTCMYKCMYVIIVFVYMCLCQLVINIFA